MRGPLALGLLLSAILSTLSAAPAASAQGQPGQFAAAFAITGVQAPSQAVAPGAHANATLAWKYTLPNAAVAAQTQATGATLTLTWSGNCTAGWRLDVPPPTTVALDQGPQQLTYSGSVAFRVGAGTDTASAGSGGSGTGRGSGPEGVATCTVGATAGDVQPFVPNATAAPASFQLATPRSATPAGAAAGSGTRAADAPVGGAAADAKPSPGLAPLAALVAVAVAAALRRRRACPSTATLKNGRHDCPACVASWPWPFLPFSPCPSGRKAPASSRRA